jgi:type II secretory pathway pseudopilin PulG
MTSKHRLTNREAGFTLIAVTILLTVAALVMVSFLPGKQSGSKTLKAKTTAEKLEQVEQAVTGFMARNGRRPCPADGQYGVNTANFGIEGATPGTCTGSTPAAPLGPDAGTGYVVGGVIPTKSLGLDDSFAFDEWGRFITYVVDKRTTLKSSCLSLQNYPTDNGTGGVAIESSTGGTVLGNVMAAYISHGPDGHGAFPEQGSTVANRINAGSIDTDEMTNAGVNSSFAYSTANFTNVKVQKSPTATFGDIVYYANYQKNLCCVGGATSCGNPGFRANGEVTSGEVGAGVAMGDVNGDGIQDLVICGPYPGGTIYVLFGKSGGGFTNPTPLNSTGLNGTTGITLTSSTSICVGGLAVADLNHDGYADIITADGYGTNYVFYGAASYGAASYNLNSMTACQGFEFYDAVNDNAFVTAGDVNGDGIQDLIMSAQADGPYASGTVTFTTNPTNNETIVLNGQTWTFTTGSAGSNKTVIQGTLAATLSTLATNLNASGTGKIQAAFYSASSTVLTVIEYTTGTAGNAYTLAVGTAASSVSGATLTGGAAGYGAVYVMFGQNVANNCAAGTGSLNGTNKKIGFGYLSSTSSPKGATIYAASSDTGGFFAETLAVGDINGDGYGDIVIGDDGYPNDQGQVYVVAGQPAASWPSSITVSNLAGIAAASPGPACNSGGITPTTCGFHIASNAYLLGNMELVGDITGDGIADIVVGANSSFYIVKGSASAWAANYTLQTSTFPGGTALKIRNSTTNDLVPEAIGDVNGDGKNDLLFSDQAASTYGSVYVLFGPITAARNLSTTPPTGGTDGVRIDCPYSNGGTCGLSTSDNGGDPAMAVGDMNGDGIPDLAIGVNEGSVTGSNQEGYVYVLYGHTNASSAWPATYSLGTIY